MSRSDARTTAQGSPVDAFGVDFSRPVFGQLDALGDRYWDWVHVNVTPRFRDQIAAALPDTRWPGSFPIFANPWLDRQTHIDWRHVLGLWGPVALACFVLAVAWRGLAWPEAVAWALGGFVGWTLVEYLLHRVVFHAVPHSGWHRKFHFLAHGIHHKDPWDGSRLVFPILGGLGIATVLFGAFNLLLPLGASLAAMSGLLVGYLGYDLGHMAWHHAACRRGVLRYLKRYHLAHHFKDQDSRFGVSQPLWDWVFRSGDLRL